MPRSNQEHNKQTEKANSQLEEVQRLSKFYKEYITENLSVTENTDKIENLLNKYCTNSFREKLSSLQLDADPIVDAQDYEEEWINNMSIIKLENASHEYQVCFLLSFDNSQHCIFLTLKKEDDLWKINNISPVN